MFRRSLLPVVRPRPSDAPGLLYDEGTAEDRLILSGTAPLPPPRHPAAPGPLDDEGVEEDGIILSGTARLPATGETYPVKNGYLDLLKGRLAGDNVAHPPHSPPGAGRGPAPLRRG